MDPVASRGERLAMRDLLRILARTALILVLGIGLAEIILQGAALFVHDRQAGWRPEAAHRILCLGDSHTYGAMVPAEESYPGHLQRLLDERAPGAYAVVNLGIPGFNTTQVRARLRAALGRYRPEMVIVWCGVNNAWNRGASIGGAGWWSQLDATLGILRTYRLLRVWLHDRTLEGIGAEPMPHQRYEVDQDAHDPYKKFTLRMDGRTERIVLADAGTRADAEVEAEAEEDYRGMVEEARAAGVGIAFVAYPVDHAAFLPANRAVRRVAAAYHVPLVECLRSTNRLPEEQRQLLWAAHPNGAIYGEVARDLVPIVLSRGAVVRSAGDIPGTPLARVVFGENDGSRGPPGALAVNGTCGPDSAGPAGTVCYRWNPRGTVCNVQKQLSDITPALRAAVRLRVAEFPSEDGGRAVYGVFADAFKTGVYVEFTERDRLRVRSSGSAGATQGYCGPLASHLAPNTWYGVEVRAEKSERARIVLELHDDTGRVLDSVACANQPTGPGFFTRAILGDADPRGATADVRLAALEIDAAAGPAGPAPPD